MLTEIELAEVKKHFPAEAAAALTVENGLVKLCEKHLELSTLAVELDKQVKDGSQVAMSNVDHEVAEMLAEGTQEKLKALVASGKITPAVQAKLELALVGPASARNVYALSRTASKTEKSLAAAVIEALAENTPPKLGEKTGAQVRELSRVVPDGKPETESKAVTETMVKMANGERVI